MCCVRWVYFLFVGLWFLFFPCQSPRNWLSCPIIIFNTKTFMHYYSRPILIAIYRIHALSPPLNSHSNDRYFVSFSFSSRAPFSLLFLCRILSSSIPSHYLCCSVCRGTCWNRRTTNQILNTRINVEINVSHHTEHRGVSIYILVSWQPYDQLWWRQGH